MAHIGFVKNLSPKTSIYFQDWHPDETPRAVIALVHGLGEHSGRYQHWGEMFNQENIGLISFDLSGHGRSTGKRGHTSYDEANKDISLLLDEARSRYPDTPIFLYGHSLGGALVSYYILCHRPNIFGAIITSPGLTIGTPQPPIKIMIAKIVNALSLTLCLPSGLDQSNLSRDPDVVKNYANDPLVHDLVSTRLGMDLLTKGEWLLENADEFHLPLLLMQGTDDHLVSVEATRTFSERVPQDNITYKEWTGFYHELHNEPEKLIVFDYVHEWIGMSLKG